MQIFGANESWLGGVGPLIKNQKTKNHPSSFIIHHSSFIIHHPPSSSIIHHPSSIIHHPPSSSIIHHPPSSAPSSILHHPLHHQSFPSRVPYEARVEWRRQAKILKFALQISHFPILRPSSIIISSSSILHPSSLFKFSIFPSSILHHHPLNHPHPPSSSINHNHSLPACHMRHAKNRAARRKF